MSLRKKQKEPNGYINVIDCSDCHCMSRCYAEYECNLGYGIKLMCRKDGGIIYCSTECKLVEVITKDGVYKNNNIMATSLGISCTGKGNNGTIKINIKIN